MQAHGNWVGIGSCSSTKCSTLKCLNQISFHSAAFAGHSFSGMNCMFSVAVKLCRSASLEQDASPSSAVNTPPVFLSPLNSPRLGYSLFLTVFQRINVFGPQSGRDLLPQGGFCFQVLSPFVHRAQILMPPSITP